MEIKLEAVWESAKEPKMKVQLAISKNAVEGNRLLVTIGQDTPFLKLLLESMLGDQFWTKPIGTKWEVRELPEVEGLCWRDD